VAIRAAHRRRLVEVELALVEAGDRGQARAGGVQAHDVRVQLREAAGQGPGVVLDHLARLRQRGALLRDLLGPHADDVHRQAAIQGFHPVADGHGGAEQEGRDDRGGQPAQQVARTQRQAPSAATLVAD
jgi:hypothetical protein